MQCRSFFLQIQILSSVLCLSFFQDSFSSEKALFFEGTWHEGQQDLVAVLDVPYFICPVGKDHGMLQSMLAFKEGKLASEKEALQSTLFKFSRKDQSSKIQLKSILSDKELRFEFRNKPLLSDCVVHILDRKGTIFIVEILFSAENLHEHEVYLYHTNNGSSVGVNNVLQEGFSSCWRLIPAYNVIEKLNRAELEPDSQLYKVSRKLELYGNFLISADQFRALYRLSPKKTKVTLLKESDDDFLLAFEDMMFETGFFITATDGCPLRVFNVKGFELGVGQSCELAKTNAFTSDNDQVDVEVGKTLYLKPQIKAGTVSPIGKIEVVVGTIGRLMGVYYQGEPIKLVHATEYIGSNFIYTKVGNTYTFSSSNANVITSFGRAAAVSGVLARQAANEAREAVTPLAQSIERFGQSGEIATSNIRESSKDLSMAIEGILKALSAEFNGAIKLLGEMSSNVTGELRVNAQIMSSKLEITSQALVNRLGAIQLNFNEELGKRIHSASRLLIEALSIVIAALKTERSELGNSISEASNKFVRGVDSISEAIGKLSNTKHDFNVCTIQ